MCDRKVKVAHLLNCELEFLFLDGCTYIIWDTSYWIITATYTCIPYFLEMSPHLELSPPSKSRRVVLTLNALNAALEFSQHVVKGRHYYCEHVRNILTLILNTMVAQKDTPTRYPILQKGRKRGCRKSDGE